jgi:uncharacterized protein (TIGR03435 family)
MPDVNDMELIRAYARQDSEDAFAELVCQHISLVYSTAYRHVGIAAHAEEITQAVFVVLARKAGSLRRDTVLDAWLYETTRLTSLSFLRGERRRRLREQEAYMQSTLQEHNDTVIWNQLAPLLDEAMAGLGKEDREAVVLRFFKDKNLSEVAAALNITETAAQSRVYRAVEKLRGFFSKRGVALSSVAITCAISANSVQDAPAMLAKTVTAVAMTKGAAASGSTLTLIKGALKVMAATKVKTVVAVSLGVLLATGVTTVTVTKVRQQKTYSRQQEVYAWQVPNPTLRILNETPPRVEILPTKFSKPGNIVLDGERVLGVGASIAELIAVAYDNTWTPARTILPPNLPQQRFDFIANLPTGSRKALLEKIANQFHIIGRSETREVDAMVLTVMRPNTGGLKSASGHGLHFGDGHYDARGQTMGRFTKDLESYFGVPIVDQTGLPGSYDFNLKWIASGQPASNNANLKQALLNQLGLELVSNKMAIEMLIVEEQN